MKIDRIVIDLDDTLNSCTMFLLHTLGCGVGPFDYNRYPVEVGYDMIAAWAKLCGREPVDVSVFWEWVSRRTWERMPKSRQFWLLDTAAAMVGRENVLIATSPTKSADCHFAKYQWIQEHIPDWCKRQYDITPRKHWLSQPGVLLIDDCDQNVETWRNPPKDRPGGEAILVPRPWNSLSELGIDDVATHGYLDWELEKIEI